MLLDGESFVSQYWQLQEQLAASGYQTNKVSNIGKLHITPANTHECNHLSPLPEGIHHHAINSLPVINRVISFSYKTARRSMSKQNRDGID